MPRAIATASDALSIERSAQSAARFERPAKQEPPSLERSERRGLFIPACQ